MYGVQFNHHHHVECAAHSNYHERAVIFLSRGKCNVVCHRGRFQLFVEYRSYLAKHNRECNRQLRGVHGLDQRLYFPRNSSSSCICSTTGKRNRLWPPQFLPRRKCNTECSGWLQLFVEQRRYLAEHHGHRGGFLHGNGFPERLQQYLCGTGGCGECQSARHNNSVGLNNLLPRG